MPAIAPLVLSNGTANVTYSVSTTKGVGHDVAFKSLAVSPAAVQPVITVKAAATDVRRTFREKLTFPCIGVDAMGRQNKVGVVEVDISLRADLVATEAEINVALATARASLDSTNSVLGNCWYKGEALY